MLIKCNHKKDRRAKACRKCFLKEFSHVYWKGKHHSFKTKKIIGLNMMGVKNSLGYKHTKETKEKQINKWKKSDYRQHQAKVHSISSKKMWRREGFKEKHIAKVIKASTKTYNKKERYLNLLLRKMFPNEYKYVGSGNLIINGFNPDFINCNGQKKIIELYGDYWHSRPEVIERDKRRIKSYTELGYKTLIVQENELKDKENLKTKILEFHND